MSDRCARGGHRRDRGGVLSSRLTIRRRPQRSALGFRRLAPTRETRPRRSVSRSSTIGTPIRSAVLVCNPGAMGLGLNLQKGNARTVCWFSHGFSHSQRIQLNARLIRSGQRHVVSVISLVADIGIDRAAWVRSSEREIANRRFCRRCATNWGSTYEMDLPQSGQQGIRPILVSHRSRHTHRVHREGGPKWMHFRFADDTRKRVPVSEKRYITPFKSKRG